MNSYLLGLGLGSRNPNDPKKSQKSGSLNAKSLDLENVELWLGKPDGKEIPIRKAESLAKSRLFYYYRL